MMGWLKVGDLSAVAEARRRARRQAQRMGLGSTRTEHAAIVATEIAQNVLRHGGGGKMLVQCFGATGGERLYLIGLDDGPGIERLDRVLEDGVSTLESPGTGLGAIRRLSDRMDVDTRRGAGTTIVAEFAAGGASQGLSDHAGFLLPHPGEHKCGDAVAVRSSGASTWHLVCDGLGHGPSAAAAARAARERFLECRATDPARILDILHDALVGTRGAVAAVTCLDRAHRKLDYAAIGNIATVVVQDGRSKRLPVRDGLLGGRRSAYHQECLDLAEQAVVIMHSDGLATLRGFAERRPLMNRSAAAIGARLLHEASRERDDASILVARVTAARTL